jgi:flagellar basal body rod protein FlgG
MIPEDLDPDLIRDKVQIIIGEKGNIEMNAGMQKVPMQTIGVWDFANKDDLFEISDTRFIPKTPEENPELRSDKFVIQQGMLELSNCNVIKEMINTISTQRNYESLARIVTTNGEMLDTAVALGRLRV